MSDEHEGMGVPEIVGPHGRAWDWPDRQDPTAVLKAWIVHAPWAHPAWHTYFVSVVHLRPVEMLPKPLRYDESATHEVGVLALDPKHEVKPGEPYHILTPPNYMEQFTATDDAAAIAHARRAVVDICNGQLSPDTYFQADWLRRFPFQNPGRRALKVVAKEIMGDGMSRSRK